MRIIGKDFCAACGEERPYYMSKVWETYIPDEKDSFPNKPFRYQATAALCSVCGGRIDLPELYELNTREYMDAYCDAFDLIHQEELERLLSLYQIGKAPLSLALGFGEVTITRWLSGCFPSRSKSEICRRALSDPSFMRQCLRENRDRISGAAFRKADSAAAALEKRFDVSPKLLQTVSALFEELEEVTPLMLQKLLYFIQGLALSCLGRSLFPEDCEAWVHGPVYRPVYEMFRDFRYNPIEDTRFSLVEGKAEGLEEEEREVIRRAAETFGRYSGKTLEQITHRESPWQEAREGLAPEEPGKIKIPQDAIASYYHRIGERYDLGTAAGVMNYIEDILGEEASVS